MKQTDYNILEELLFEAKTRLNECRKEQNSIKMWLDAINADLQVLKYGSRENYLQQHEEHKMGVYEFHNLIDDIYYIGSATDIEQRKQDHIQAFPSDDFHKDLHIKGIENFSFKVLEYCLTRREAYKKELNYIHDYQRAGLKLYNKAGLINYDN